MPSINRRSCLAVLGVVATVTIPVTVIKSMLASVPPFYLESTSVTADSSRTAARRFRSDMVNTWNRLQERSPTSCVIHQSEVNAWLRTELPDKHSSLLPATVSLPQVMFSQDEVQLGFQYESIAGPCIIHLTVRPWIVGDTTLALEITQSCAGSIRFPRSYIMNMLNQQAGHAGWSVEWKSHDGNPVAMIDLEPAKRTVTIQSIHVNEGKLTLSGHHNGDELATKTK